MRMFDSTVSFLKTSYKEWSDDKVSKLAAALAYYAIFSVAPIFVIGIAIAGYVYGQKAVQGQVVEQMRGVIGEEGANIVQTMIAGARNTSAGVAATVLSVLALFLGASGVFIQLQYAMNVIWEVERKPGRGIMGMVIDRFFAVIMVIAVGIIIIALMFGSSVMWTLTGYFKNILPIPSVFWQIFNYLVNFILLTPVFALILKVVPDVKIGWREVWVGAAFTGFLFSIGQLLIGLYLGHSSFTSSYGIAGAVLLLLVWIYYSAQIFLFGAEMTQVYARRYGKRIEPADNAISTRKEPPEQST
jgi:membrane protein